MKRQIIDTIEQYEKIIIHRHVRPDPDAYGSQMGLKALIEKNYPTKQVLAAGEHDILLGYLGEPDTVTEADYEGALVIVTDTANTDRIDSQLYNTGAFLLKIDHHPNEDPYGDKLWVNTDASSCSEMVYSIFEEGQANYGWEMSPEAARFLFAGIVGDTGRFMFQSTTEKTFEAASALIKQPFDRTALFAGMYEVERKILHLQGYIYQNFTIDENGAAYIKLTKEILEEFDVTVSETSQLVGSLGDVKGICAWIIFIEEDDQIRVRLRSKGPVINTLAMQHNGGGHPLASGASAYSWDEVDEIIGKLQDTCRNY